MKTKLSQQQIASPGKLKVMPFTIAGPNDPIYQRGLSITVPIARPIQKVAQIKKKK